MLSEIKGTVLAGAVTFSGLGGIPQTARVEANLPQPIIRTNVGTSSGTETPIITFDQETYTPSEEDALQISSIMQVFLDAGTNPDFANLMNDRFFNDFDEYFGIFKAPKSFGFQYSPFGKNNPVGIEFIANEDIITDSDGNEFNYLTNAINILVGDDGTLFTPRVSVDLFPVETLPEMVEANIVMDGMESIEWESDLADPARQIVLKEVITSSTSYIAAGDTLGNLFLGTESITPASAEQ